MKMRRRLRVALWLGDRLPFRWAPRCLNNRLARWMWATPDFDEYELGVSGGVRPQP
jgi:hypothetical protein